MRGIETAVEELGLSKDQLIEKTNIGEDESCADAAEDLVSDGCQLVFATSFGHEDYLMEVAKNHPDLQFAHATGFQAATSGLDNFANYFDNIYEARYVSGIVAGMKLKEMIDEGKITADQAKIGYVGAYPYAEVISGFTAFYLGAKSIVPEATMKVLYTNSWADLAAEAETAKQLISDGCVLIGQHADTTGAPSACQEEGVPCVGYNVDMTSVAPDVALTSPTNNWAVYYKYAIECVMNGAGLRASTRMQSASPRWASPSQQVPRMRSRQLRKQSRQAPCMSSIPAPSPSTALPWKTAIMSSTATSTSPSLPVLRHSPRSLTESSL